MKNQIKDKVIFIILIIFFSLMIVFGFVADRFDSSKPLKSQIPFLAQLFSPTAPSQLAPGQQLSAPGQQPLEQRETAPPQSLPVVDSAPEIETAPFTEDFDTAPIPAPMPIIENSNATSTSPAEYRVLLGHKIKKLPSGLKAVSARDFTTDLTINPQTQAQYVVIKNSAGKIIGKIYVNFALALGDIDFSGITAETDISARKSVMHKASWPREVSVSKTLYIPSTGVGEVYICPGAASINEVNPACPNKITIRVGKTISGISVNTVEIQGQKYYEVSGITGTGGGESSPTFRSPSSTTGGWSIPDGAYADGGTSAYINSAKPSASQTYSGYGFNLPLDLPITQVRIRYDARTDGNEQIRVNVSWDGGTTWSSQQVTALTTTETTYWYDVTAVTTWNSTKLNDTNLRVKVDAYTVGGATAVYLDWIPVEVIVADTISPTVTLNSPANSSTTTSPVTFSYAPSDDYGLDYCELWGNWSISFTGYNISTTTNSAQSVYAIDLDGDGDVDVLSASGGVDGRIDWYENDGSQVFTAHNISTTVSGAQDVFAIDLDGDGDVDVLAAATFADEVIAWYENNGDKTFTEYTISAIDSPQSVYAIDLDGDGDIDVLSESYNGDRVVWYENNGNKTFTEHDISITTDAPESVYAIDLDGDGDIDVLSASYWTNGIAWYENNGFEVFTTHNISAGDGAQDVYAIDLDGDGDIDVLSAWWPGLVAWYENNGDKTFTEHNISTTVDDALSVYAIDLDGDGDVDVLNTSRNDNRVVWHENDGNENFTEHNISATANGAKDVFAIDVDGDGDIDVLSASIYDDKIAWYENALVWGSIKTDNNPINGIINSFSSVNIDNGNWEWNVKCYDFGGNSAFAPANWTFSIGVEAAPTLTQNFFRFYVNNDALDPTDPWPIGAADLGENAAITSSNSPPASGENLRIRMSIQVGGVNLSATSSAFKLQFTERVTTCSAVSSWTDLGAIGGGAIWRGFDATPVDGAALSGDPPTAGALNLSVSDRAGTYEEANNTALNPFAVLVGEDVEYDWVIQDNNALGGTNYCFRMVKADGIALNGYNYYPALITVGFSPKSQNWRWYNDETNETPIAPLAAENVAPADIVNQNIIKLRLTIKETANVAGTDIKFKLQFSESSDFSSGVNDVVEIGSCTTNSLWCYGNGIDVDNASITTLVLTDSTSAGTHNESGISASTFDPAANTAVEYEFTIKHAGARANHTYFFRAFDATNNKAVPLNSGETFPSLSTQGGTLTFSIGGLAAGVLTEGITTDVSTTPIGVSFGTLSFNSEIEAAQRLTATTNATEGYQIFMFSRQGLLGSGSSEIAPVTGINESPTSWAIGCVSAAAGCYGYHTGDDTLAGASTRFAPNDTYAKFETTAKEIAFNSGPVTNESTDVVFKTQITNQQDAGNYLSNVVYILVPTF